MAWYELLLQAAVCHAADIAQKNYFSHTVQEGRSHGQRVTATTYDWSHVGEKIAMGQRSVEEVMTGWTNSPDHCQNLLNPDYRDVAIACVRNDAGDHRFCWALSLGCSR